MKKVASLLIIACVACSGGASDKDASTVAADTTAQPAASASVCSMIPDADLTEAIGASIDRHEEESPKKCTYYTANPVVYAGIEIDSENAATSWAGVNAGNSLIDAAQDSLTGIGDKAFFGPGNRLYILKGNTYAAIEAGFDDKVRERALKIAKVVVSKM